MYGGWICDEGGDNMQDFQLHMPTRIVFGRGDVDKVGQEAAKIAGKALVVTGRTSTK